jgi:hypothetical protein
MMKLLVGVFALACLAAPLFATDAPVNAPQDAASAASNAPEKKAEVAADCGHCKKPTADCGCKKGKDKKKKKKS